MKELAVKSLFVMLLMPLVAWAQAGDADGKKVMTGDGFTIEIDANSLELGPDRQIAARYRTSLAKPQLMADIKYKTRIETIRFDLKQGKYQYLDANFLDGSGKVLGSSPTASEWKPIQKSAVVLYNAARELPPFGSWKIVGYHYTNGDTPGNDEPAELKSLIGNYAVFFPNEFRLGNSNCPAPLFFRRTLTRQDVTKQLGPPEKALSSSASNFDVLQLSCESGTNVPSSTYIFPLANRRTMMVWEGVLLELESPGTSRWSFLKDMVIR